MCELIITPCGKLYLTFVNIWRIILIREGSVAMYYREWIKRRKEKKPRSFEVFVRAVATGIFVVSLFLNLVFFVILIFIGIAVSSLKDKELMNTGYRKIYHEGVFFDSRGKIKNEIALIRVEGIISEYDSQAGLFEYRENVVSAVKNRLDIIRKDENVKGVIVIIESPGGEITASDIVYHAISSFRQETGIPVLALLKQVAASGAYYIASAADAIAAYPTTITGSIGVIISTFNFKSLMDRYGVQYIAIKSGKHKDLISPFKSIDEEELSRLQSIVDQMLEQFIDRVAEGRKNLSRQDVRRLADGRIYIAQEAFEKGLIDKIGYFEDAVATLKEMAGVPSAALVEYQRERGIRDIFGGVNLNLLPEASFKRLFPLHERYGIYYLWESVITGK